VLHSRSCIPVAILVSSLILDPGRPAAAAPTDDCDRAASEFDCYATENGSITISVGRTATADGQRHISSTDQEPSASEVDTAPAEIGAAFCANSGSAMEGTDEVAPEIEALCGFLPVGRARVVPGQAEVLAAFREIGLYRGAVRSDPERVSFVNLETYFWCGDGAGTCAALGEGERTVTLLGQAVRIRPRIVGYEWRFGDGSSQHVTAGRVAHTYGRPGAMAVSVTLTWTADYAVAGGGFRAIGGTTTTTSPVRVLPVQETQTVGTG
jgi:hypothetical protein